jgi:hypothetical protein
VDNEKIIKVIEDCENSPNADLIKVRDLLVDEFEETKRMLLQLSEHLDKLEECYNKVEGEIKKRTGK